MPDKLEHGLPVPEMLSERQPWWQSFLECYREVTGPRKIVRVKGDPNQPALYRAPNLTVEFEAWKESFRWTLQQLYRPEKLPPLPPSPVKVSVDETLVDAKASNEQMKRTQALSLLVHATVLVLLTIPLARQVLNAQPAIDLVSLESDVLLGLPPAPNKAGGGGGGGDRSQSPASQGRLPRASLQQQLVAPSVKINNPDAALQMEPTLYAQENLWKNSDLANLGDPLSNSGVLSGGPGGGSGIGSGYGTGVGPGSGPGFGPGSGGNAGGGYFLVGGDVSQPLCLECPDPKFSDEARKARYQGSVTLDAIVDKTGRVRPDSIRVLQSLGMGLDEEAIRAVQTWLFRPAERQGQPVAVRMNIVITFTIY